MGSDEKQTTRLTRKGQTTIPKPLREAFGIEEGDELQWEAKDGALVVRKAEKSAGRGMLVDDTVSKTKREEMAEELEADIRKKRQTEWAVE